MWVLKQLRIGMWRTNLYYYQKAEPSAQLKISYYNIETYLVIPACIPVCKLQINVGIEL
jgi:hypothetical protein